MSDQQSTVTDRPVWWTVPDDPTAAAVLDAQMRIIDAAVRSARRHDWCTSFEAVMERAFPDGPPDGSVEFVDSDGYSCRGRDREGYDQSGYNADGFNREGFNYDGYDREGYGRDGFNAAGWSRDGWNREHTVNRDSEEYRARFKYDGQGYDADGFNREGRHRDSGLSGDEHAAWARRRAKRTYRFDQDGYDINGLDRYGFQRS